LKVDGTVRLVSGTLHCVTDTLAEGNAISVDDAYIQDGGALLIEANGNVHASESKGLKVNGRESEENAKGYLVINGGSVDITSVGKAMTAGWKAEEDGETETLSDDPTPNLIINGGVLHLTTTGTPYEYSDEESLSPEGLEAKNKLEINGGYIEISATDDALNAGGSIVLNGGILFAYSRSADALDSNGTVIINGGEAVLLGAGGAEMGLDMDINSAFTYHGGTVVAMGGGNNTPGAKDTDACVISFQSPVSAGSSFALVDEKGNAVVAFQIPSWYNLGSSVEVLSSDLKIGSTYRLVGNTEVTSSSFFNGLYRGEVTTSGGSELASYTISSFVTGGEGGMFGGMRGGMEGERGMRMNFQDGQAPENGMGPDMRGGQKNNNFWMKTGFGN
ncbi:MAG: carbohydrate-binding domain-containing protein, partial [Spirochaetales bacterium]|nr:carbohydrate-binding domain-containing protein [Candidatus Physcosoma equi]